MEGINFKNLTTQSYKKLRSSLLRIKIKVILTKNNLKIIFLEIL